MNVKQIESKFAAMGARLKVREIPSGWQLGHPPRSNAVEYVVDIRRDRAGEFFEIRVLSHVAAKVEATVLQSEPRQRHLLLLLRKTAEQPQLDRFLCGHDERAWFVAAVPGGASSVAQAMQALQPTAVREALGRHRVSSRRRFSRKNRAFRRQGEWFFVPEPGLVVNEKLVFRNEPLRRGAGKPHWVDQLYRVGGETVHVSSKHPNGLTEVEYREVLHGDAGAASWGWRVMRRDASVYARGAVRHADHAVITLPFWHRVSMNTETQARAMANLAFLD